MYVNLLGPITIAGGDFVPFPNEITNYANAGPAYLMSFDPQTKHIIVPYASTNDYYIHWQIALRTAYLSQQPIISLEMTYNNITRSDTFMAPMKTQDIATASVFHVTNVSTEDVLTIGLKVIGEPDQTYSLRSDSTANISANMLILGL